MNNFQTNLTKQRLFMSVKKSCFLAMGGAPSAEQLCNSDARHTAVGGFSKQSQQCSCLGRQRVYGLYPSYCRNDP